MVRDEKSLRLILDLMSLSNTSGQGDKVGRGRGRRGDVEMGSWGDGEMGG